MVRLTIISLCSITILFISSQLSVAQQYKYGTVDFEVSCNKTVQADFDRALAMLHNMMYVTARNVFKEITRTDRNCAMAYWGIATTLFQPLWGTRPSEADLQNGLRNSEKALELVNSDRERALIKATTAFFREPEAADFQTRINRWAEAMEAVYESHSDDLDIAALYALTRLTKAQSAENPSPLFEEAEEILRNVFEEEPTHPGAIHYTIHATDIDGRAENALGIVEAYGEIAPAVPHALHMPTHIYVRLGDWPNVIDWNIRSAKAALNHPVDDAESHHYLHAIDYLVYAYLQQGKDGKAEEAFNQMLAKDRYQASFISAFHSAAIPARLAIERQEWEQAASLEPRQPDYLPWDESPWPEGLTWYAKGLGAVHTGDIGSAKEAEQKLRELRDRANDNGAGNMATYIEINRQVLKGWIEHAEGNDEQAIELLHSAAELEKTVEKHPVTPGALQPPYEALGDLLMDLDRPKEALEAYEASDNIWPGRLNTLIGAAVSARVIGEYQRARHHIVRLLNSNGNTETPASGSGNILGATDQ